MEVVWPKTKYVGTQVKTQINVRDPNAVQSITLLDLKSYTEAILPQRR